MLTYVSCKAFVESISEKIGFCGGRVVDTHLCGGKGERKAEKRVFRSGKQRKRSKPRDGGGKKKDQGAA